MPGAWHLPTRYRRCQRRWMRTFGPSYELRHSQIQMALKLDRMKSINQKYYERIMSPVRVVWPVSYWDCVFSPKIVSGKFLLRVERAIRVSVGGRPSPLPSPPPSGSSGLANNIHLALENDFYLALQNPGQRTYGSCNRCPADYVVWVTGERAHFNTWHDFGLYQSQANSKEWKPLAIPDQIAVYHIPGSIRMMYYMG